MQSGINLADLNLTSGTLSGTIGGVIGNAHGGWMLIETAPINRRVEVGRWERFASLTEWQSRIEMAYKTKFFGLFRIRTRYGREYTHWRETPPPPDDESPQPSHTKE